MHLHELLLHYTVSECKSWQRNVSDGGGKKNTRKKEKVESAEIRGDRSFRRLLHLPSPSPNHCCSRPTVPRGSSCLPPSSGLARRGGTPCQNRFWLMASSMLINLVFWWASLIVFYFSPCMPGCSCPCSWSSKPGALRQRLGMDGASVLWGCCGCCSDAVAMLW